MGDRGRVVEGGSARRLSQVETKKYSLLVAFRGSCPYYNTLVMDFVIIVYKQ